MLLAACLMDIFDDTQDNTWRKSMPALFYARPVNAVTCDNGVGRQHLRLAVASYTLDTQLVQLKLPMPR